MRSRLWTISLLEFMFFIVVLAFRAECYSSQFEQSRRIDTFLGFIQTTCLENLDCEHLNLRSYCCDTICCGIMEYSFSYG